MLPKFRSDLRSATKRLGAVPSSIADTALGPIEYVDSGAGPPILVVHGVTGGCDHGVGIVDSYLGPGFRTIAVSRFGYLQSPVLADGGPEAQADAYAELLDRLGIERAGVLGTSAGTSSVLQFARRHPDRCAAVALFSMAVGPYKVPGRIPLAVLRRYFGSDFLFWASFKLSERLKRRLMGVPGRWELEPDDAVFVAALAGSFLPVSRRASGIVNDIRRSNPGVNDPRPFSEIRVPILAVHAEDDPWGEISGAERAMGHIPTSELIRIPSGGHLLLGHRDEVRGAFGQFMHDRIGRLAAVPNP